MSKEQTAKDLIEISVGLVPKGANLTETLDEFEKICLKTTAIYHEVLEGIEDKSKLEPHLAIAEVDNLSEEACVALKSRLSRTVSLVDKRLSQLKGK